MNHTKAVRPNKRCFLQAVGIDPDGDSVTRTIAEKMFDRECGPYTSGDHVAENYAALCEKLKIRIDTINRQYLIDYNQKNPCDMIVALCLDYASVTDAVKQSKKQETRDIALNMCLNIENFLQSETPQQVDFDNQNPFAKFIIVSILTQQCKDHNEKLDKHHKSHETGYVADYNEAELDSENASLRRFADIDFVEKTSAPNMNSAYAPTRDFNTYRPLASGDILNQWMRLAKRNFIYRRTNTRRIELSL